MEQSTFDTLTLGLIGLYYDKEMRGVGPICYFQAEQQLASDFPELRRNWWQDNSWLFDYAPVFSSEEINIAEKIRPEIITLEFSELDFLFVR